MDEDKLLNTTDEFRAILSEQIRKVGEEHVWLKGVNDILISKTTLETVLEDVNTIEKYFKSNKHILDFGTGSGYIAYLLGSLNYEVNGIDIDDFVKQESIETHGTMANDQKIIWPILETKNKKITLRHYKNAIPYDDSSFEGVVAYAVIEHIPDNDIPHVMREIRRVLKPNGFLYIAKLPRKSAYMEHLAKLLGLGHHTRLYNDTEINSLLKKNGFEILEKSYSEMFPAYPAHLTNSIFPISRHINKILLKTPLKYYSHNIALMSRKVPDE